MNEFIIFYVTEIIMDSDYTIFFRKHSSYWRLKNSNLAVAVYYYTFLFVSPHSEIVSENVYHIIHDNPDQNKTQQSRKRIECEAVVFVDKVLLALKTELGVE